MNRKQRRAAAKGGKSRKVSIEEALPLAIKLHRNGQLEQAEAVYHQILDILPDHGDALHFLGLVRYQQGQWQQAVALIERSLAINPNHPDAHNNLGNILKNQGKVEEATACYRKAIALNPNQADAHNNLGILLREGGKADEAITAYRRAIILRPDHADAYHNLGNALAGTGRLDEAITAYRQALALNPRHFEAYKSLGQTLHKAGQVTQAETVFRQWLDIDPDNPVALHMLAACSGQDTPARASDRYVQHLFDHFADTFDRHLQRLDYHAPQHIIDTLLAIPDFSDHSWEVLDAGCGTGLCGPLLRPHARRLTGLDLSPKMLDKARERDVYDQLITAELTAFLESTQQAYDLIVSADTLVYFGDLQPVIRAASTALRANGLLVFTLERTEDNPAAGFGLNPHGRYYHSESYVREVTTAAGFAVESITPVVLRQEDNQPVHGMVVLTRKKLMDEA